MFLNSHAGYGVLLCTLSCVKIGHSPKYVQVHALHNYTHFRHSLSAVRSSWSPASVESCHSPCNNPPQCTALQPIEERTGVAPERERERGAHSKPALHMLTCICRLHSCTHTHSHASSVHTRTRTETCCSRGTVMPNGNDQM